jgi:DMSO/TMAO reductase YedYZ molybdopterin-dependent catalytic subunit
MSPSLPPGQQLVAPGKWPIVGERQPRASRAPWTVTIATAAGPLRVFTLEDLAALPQTELCVDIHCVTRWSKLAVPFRGVMLEHLLAYGLPSPLWQELRNESAREPPGGPRGAASGVLPQGEAPRYVSFVARSDRGHSTSLPLADALALRSLVALQVEGQPLAEEHGGPVRVVVPGRYFYKSLKWLERIELLADDRLGFWEATAGYHNTADPWQQQRYMAPTLSRREAEKLLAARDFSGRDLRSIDATHHHLDGLQARHALLRDARFVGCTLRGACFDGANLSNAHFQQADLRDATFRGADVEGADFTGADLRGADFTGASLMGVTFCHEPGLSPPLAARIDASTRIAPQQIEQLTPLQMAFVLQALTTRPAPHGGTNT